MASPPPASRRTGAGTSAEQSLLPDEVLEVIFLRLDSGYDLARASAACRAFHRVATDGRFLRRFTSLHPPPVVGVINLEANQGFIPAEPPHRSTPAARALAQAGDYRFSFLGNSWILCDVRDRRFLLSRNSSTVLLELVVSDPLYRRYVQIPPIPGDLVPRMPSCGAMLSEPFLAPAQEAGLEEDSHFRVIYNWVSIYKLVTFVFSTASEKWCCATTFRFVPARLILNPKKLQRYYARGLFCWVHREEKYMLVLDPCQMKFSLVLHGKNQSHRGNGTVRGLALMDAAQDRLGLLTLDIHMLDLYTKPCQNNGVGEEEWRHDKFIPLPQPYYKYSIIGATEGYLLLRAVLYKAGFSSEKKEIQCFLVNLETFVFETLCMLNGGNHHGYPYASFPPPLSLPGL